MIYGPGEFQPTAIKSMDEHIEQASRTKQLLYSRVRISTRHALLALSKGERIYTVETVEGMIGFHLVYYTLGEGNILHRGILHHALKLVPFKVMNWEMFNEVQWFLDHHAYHESDLELINEKPVPFEENREPEIEVEVKKEGVHYIYVPTGDGEHSISVSPGAILSFPSATLLTYEDKPEPYDVNRQYGMISKILNETTIVAYLKVAESVGYREFIISSKDVSNKWEFQEMPKQGPEGITGVDVIYAETKQYNKTVPIKKGERIYVKRGSFKRDGRIYNYDFQSTNVKRFVSKDDMLVTVTACMKREEGEVFTGYNKHDIIICWTQLEGMKQMEEEA